VHGTGVAVVREKVLRSVVVRRRVDVEKCILKVSTDEFEECGIVE
jgi:hypothetical protein